MIDPDQLTEALAKSEPYVRPVIREACQALLDFPTDEMVDAGINALDRVQADDQVVRDVLEAVRRSMIGDTDG